jgi:hypothetical protein
MIATGSPNELKEQVGGDVLEVSASRPGDLDRLVAILAGLGCARPLADARGQRVTVPTRDGVATLLAAARRIDESQIPVTDLGLRRPSLDEVFLTLTGAAQRSHAGAEDLAAIAPSDNHHFSKSVV